MRREQCNFCYRPAIGVIYGYRKPGLARRWKGSVRAVAHYCGNCTGKAIEHVKH